MFTSIEIRTISKVIVNSERTEKMIYDTNEVLCYLSGQLLHRFGYPSVSEQTWFQNQ